MPISSNPFSTARSLRLTMTLAAATVALAGLLAVPGARAGGIGPDVTVYDLYDTDNNGVSGDFRAYSLATRSCNQGDAPLNWCDEASCTGGGITSADHPVIAQNMYRLKDGRFTQIGMSWLKHGFTALQQARPGCGSGTCQATSEHFLGVGCTDPYSSFLNGNRPLGRRSEVDSTTGDFPFPYSSPGGPYAVFDQRIKVLTSDLDQTLNAGARYWMEGHYVAPDDADFGNGLNNASYREVSVNAVSHNLSFVGNTVQELPAIAAWQVMDAEVDLVAVDIPGSSPVERFHVARRVTDLGGGDFHYEYAVHNLNSDRSAISFTVDFPGAATISNAGFHDIDHHSGEPYDTADWTADLSTPGQVSWSGVPFTTDADANALRWATMFTFWFDADAGPSGLWHTLGLFKPGSPGEVDFRVTRELFADGFESGDTTAWSTTVGN